MQGNIAGSKPVPTLVILPLALLGLVLVETESLLSLGIKFTPPSNRVRLGQPLVVHCELSSPDASGGSSSVPQVSMFLYCPIAPWNSYCFQNCQSACVGIPSGECPFDRYLGGVTCNTIVTQAGRVIYEYTIPEVTSSWMPSSSSGSGDRPGFYCKSAGSSTREVWLSLSEELPAPIVPVDISTSPPEQVQKQPMRTPIVEKPPEISIAMTRSAESQSNGNAILHEMFAIGSIIVVCLSLLLNVTCCIRCVLIRQYSRSKRPARMQHAFCMAYEIEFGRRLNGLVPVKKDVHFIGSSMGDANSLLLPNSQHPGPAQNGSEFRHPIGGGLYSSMNAFSDNMSHTTGGEAPSSFIQLLNGRAYPSGNQSGSVFSILPAGATCHHQLVQQNPEALVMDLAEKQSNSASAVTMPVYQPSYQHQQIPVAIATLERARYAQHYQLQQPQQEGTSGDMIMYLAPNGQPVKLVSSLSGTRTSMMLEAAPNVPDVVSLTSHNTTEPGMDSGKPVFGEYVHRNKQMLLTRAPAVVVTQQPPIVTHQSSLDQVPGGASQWSDSGNWSGGSGGPPQVQGANGQAPGINGISRDETGQEGDILNGPDQTSGNQDHHQRMTSADRLSYTSSPQHHHHQQQQQHPSRRSSGQVRRLNHYPSHSRRRSGVAGRVQSMDRTRDLDATTEDDTSDWSTSVYGEDVGESIAKAAGKDLEFQYSVC